MRKTFFVISTIIILLFLYLISINIHTTFGLNVIRSNFIDTSSHIGLIDSNGYYIKTLNLSVYTFLTLVSGIFIGSGIFYMFFNAQKDKTEAYKRELEKTSISGSKNASRVEVLEAKIVTLEKAFNTVIDERTKLELEIKNLNNELEDFKKEK